MSDPKVRAVAALIDAAIRVLYNSNRPEFVRIFGETDGPYLWEKFVSNFDAHEGSFICYLDQKNQEKLAQAAIDFVHSGHRKGPSDPT